MASGTADGERDRPNTGKKIVVRVFPVYMYFKERVITVGIGWVLLQVLLAGLVAV